MKHNHEVVAEWGETLYDGLVIRLQPDCPACKEIEQQLCKEIEQQLKGSK